MSRRPDPKKADGNKADGNGNSQPKQSPSPRLASEADLSVRDPRALSALDWSALALVAIALVVAPLWAGTFSSGPFLLMDGVGASVTLGLVALASGIIVWREWRRPVAIGGVPGLTGALVLLGGWAALSLLRTPVLGLSMNALAALWAALLLGGLTARLARDRNGFVALLTAIVAAGTIVAAIGVFEYEKSALPPPQGEGISNHRVFATFVNPDFLAGYLLLTLPLTLAAFAAMTERLARLALGIGLALQSGCLLLTGSRAGSAVLAIALLVWLLLSAASGATFPRRQRWPRMGMGLAIVVVGAFVASAPTRARVVGTTTASPGADSALTALQETAASQSHSGAFRRWTWISTVNMAKANPLIGTGLGAFPVTYGRTAETEYTAHAHNSYLQMAAEIGVPGLLLLLTGLAAATAFATNVLRLGRRADSPEPARTAAPDSLLRTLQFEIEAPRLLLTGLMASVIASMLHSLIDSDWYILANALTFCAVLALLVALARDLAPLATLTPRPLSPELLAAGALIALGLLWRAGATGIARQNAAEALAMQRPEEMIAAYQAAIAADPLDFRTRLDLATRYQELRRTPEEQRALQEAVQVATTGETLYRLGKFYARVGDSQAAIAAFERAQQLAPRNLQTLRALAESLLAAKQTDRAEKVWREMIALEDAPFGKVRAVPELIETNFAYAHAGLADIAMTRQRFAEAASEYARAAAILRIYWARRNWMVSLNIAPDKRQKLAELYDTVLTKWQDLLRRLGPEHAAEAAQLGAEQKGVEADRRNDAEAERKAEERAAQDSQTP